MNKQSYRVYLPEVIVCFCHHLFFSSFLAKYIKATHIPCVVWENLITILLFFFFLFSLVREFNPYFELSVGQPRVYAVIVSLIARIYWNWYKKNTKYYLKGLSKPLALKDLGTLWIFEQISAPSYLDRTKLEVSRFISIGQWSSKSLAANTLNDYASGILDSKIGSKNYQTVGHLKHTLRSNRQT